MNKLTKQELNKEICKNCFEGMTNESKEICWRCKISKELIK